MVVSFSTCSLTAIVSVCLCFFQSVHLFIFVYQLLYHRIVVILCLHCNTSTAISIWYFILHCVFAGFWILCLRNIYTQSQSWQPNHSGGLVSRQTSPCQLQYNVCVMSGSFWVGHCLETSLWVTWFTHDCSCFMLCSGCLYIAFHSFLDIVNASKPSWLWLNFPLFVACTTQAPTLA